jgi:cyanophycinase
MASAWGAGSGVDAIPAEPPRSGTLVIVGGALDADNKAVYRAFIESLPASGKVIVIPAASGSPARSARGAVEALTRHGLPSERLAIFPVAVRDDDSTPDVDEASWSGAAWDDQRVGALGAPAGFWFTGGDQTRITGVLMREDGTASPLLELVRAALAEGATVGGTSAGAAVMSDPMLAGGESFTALLEPVARAYGDQNDQESGRLVLLPGLGFLPGALVDQHFDRKARLGRLVRAMAATGQGVAYGVDEDTALIVDVGSARARVLGSGGVTLLIAGPDTRFDTGSVSGLEIGFAGPGAVFDLGACVLEGEVGQPTVGNEYFDYPVAGGGGMAFGNQRLDQVLGYDLLDNRSSRSVSRYSLRSDGALLEYRFTQTGESRGYWTDDGGPSRYSACGVRLDIEPGRWRREATP